MSDQDADLKQMLRRFFNRYYDEDFVPYETLRDRFVSDAMCTQVREEMLADTIQSLETDVSHLQQAKAAGLMVDQRLRQTNSNLEFYRSIHSSRIEMKYAYEAIDAERLSTVLNQYGISATSQNAHAVAKALPPCETDVVVPLAIEQMKERFGYDKTLPVCDAAQGVPVPGVVNGKPAQCNER